MNKHKGKLKNQPDIPLEKVYEMLFKISDDLSNCANCDHSIEQSDITSKGMIINYLTCDKHNVIEPKKRCKEWTKDVKSKEVEK